MSKKRLPEWQRYVNRLTSDEMYELLIVLLEHHLTRYDDEIRFRHEDHDCEPCFYWTASGESLLK